MIGDKINVISQSKGSAPEEEPVDPPTCGVSVLLYLTWRKYFSKRNLIRSIDPNWTGGFYIFLRELAPVFIAVRAFIFMFAF